VDDFLESGILFDCGDLLLSIKNCRSGDTYPLRDPPQRAGFSCVLLWFVKWLYKRLSIYLRRHLSERDQIL
jgi:hypothetical protein